MTIGEECRDVDDCTHVECPEDDYELECVRESCTCTHGKEIILPCLNKIKQGVYSLLFEVDANWRNDTNIFFLTNMWNNLFILNINIEYKIITKTERNRIPKFNDGIFINFIEHSNHIK